MSDDLTTWRLVLPSLLDAVALVEAGAGSAGAIDTACADRGRPGPFGMLRSTGAGTWISRLEAVRHGLRQAHRFEAPALLARLVAMPGSLDSTTAPEDGAASLAARLDLATINEAYRMVGDGVGDPPALDALLRAEGWSEGPFEMAGAIGLRAIVDGLHLLAASEDRVIRDRFQVAPVLWQVATI